MPYTYSVAQKKKSMVVGGPDQTLDHPPATTIRSKLDNNTEVG
jgi:hypothetical protein